MGQEFSIGEQVTRVIDDKDGVVKNVEFYDGEWLYYVNLGGGPTDVWAGTGSAWRPRWSLHAHVDNESQDCDGRYSSGYVLEMTLAERCDTMGDLEFKQRVLAGTVTLHGHGTLDVTPEGFTWNETTEEGYRAADVRWCEDDCDDRTWQRDHRAEEMGY